MKKWLVRIAALIVIVIVAGVAFFAITWSTPFPPQVKAASALASTQGVTVTDKSDQIVFMPGTTPKAGFVFYPGAKVAPGAYAPILHGIAEKGYAVFVVKMPFNMALLGTNKAGDIIAANPSIQTWAVGGHSLGGAAAGSFAGSDKRVKGLILFASYPATDISGRTDLAVVSIYGSNDGLATPAKIESSKPTLPASTQYVEIKGGNHGQFGDYGPQDGDGKATISPEEQTSQTIDASVALLARISGS